MNPPAARSGSDCRPEQIELFLDQELTESEQTRFEEHLEQCDACRRRLERQAARDDVWRTARESLKPSSPAAADAGPHAHRHEPSGDEPSVPDESSVAGEMQDRRRQSLTWLAPTDDPRMLGRIGPYEIAGVIGQGGMGVVFKGFDPSLNRFVAIKVLLPHLAESGAARKRFAREAKAAAAVVHDNVVAIHGVAECNGLPYLVMPYVRGESLQKRVERNGPLDVLEVLRIGRQVAAGLAAAHAQGLVHRDIKPANILLEQGVERLKITDFGLARAVDDGSVTRTGLIAGTPQYMSPEQAAGDPIDARSDLFSLGSVLYFLCTGRPPFRAETSLGILRKIADSEPRALQEECPEIPGWLTSVIGRLHAKQPAARFQSAGEVADLLEQCLSHCLQPRMTPLPAAVQTPAVAEVSNTTIQRRFAAVLWLLIPAAALALWRLGPGAEPPSTASGPSSHNPIAAAPPESSVSEQPGLWDDAVAERIDDLQAEIDAIERAGLLLWRD